MFNKAVFLDRDGTINIDKGYLYKIEDFEFIEGAENAIKSLNDHGFFVAVVTNQSGIARGYYSESDVKKLHLYVDDILKEKKAFIDAWEFCPHLDQGCNCRKPLPGMLIKLADKYKIDLKKSYMIGDKLSDVEAGLNADCTPIIVGDSSLEEFSSIKRCKNLKEAVDYITRNCEKID